jgi:hypothetical protein
MCDGQDIFGIDRAAEVGSMRYATSAHSLGY